MQMNWRLTEEKLQLRQALLDLQWSVKGLYIVVFGLAEATNLDCESNVWLNTLKCQPKQESTSLNFVNKRGKSNSGLFWKISSSKNFLIQGRERQGFIIWDGNFSLEINEGQFYFQWWQSTED